MLASLPMYDRPENAAAHDALWAGVRDRIGFGPRVLDRAIGCDAGWARPDLILGQICNLPYRATFREMVRPLGNGDYALQDTPPGYYHSVFVVRAEDGARGLAPAVLGRFAYNDAMSQSGWGAATAHITAMGLRFHTVVRTGAHIDSAKSVAQGAADLACIDAVTWRMFEMWEPMAKDLRVIARTNLSPGMTFITGQDHDPSQIRAALAAAIDDLSNTHKATLGLRGIVDLPNTAFDLPLPDQPKGSVAIGA